MGYLFENENHFDACHKRWVAKTNWDLTSSEMKDEWVEKQCGLCCFYIPLIGKFKDDYGVCSNAKSKFDGKVMFEHDGCQHFIDANKV